MRTRPHKTPADPDPLSAQLHTLNLPFMLGNYQSLAKTSAEKQWSHLDYLAELILGESAARNDRRVQRCIAQARFPVLKTLDQFDWNWPTKINRLLIQNLFHLEFIEQRANVVFISGTGLGKSHLMTALAHAACLRGHSVLFTGAIDIINTLATAHAAGSLKRVLNAYIKPSVLCIVLCAEVSNVKQAAVIRLASRVSRSIACRRASHKCHSRRSHPVMSSPRNTKAPPLGGARTSGNTWARA